MNRLRQLVVVVVAGLSASACGATTVQTVTRTDTVTVTVAKRVKPRVRTVTRTVTTTTQAAASTTTSAAAPATSANSDTLTVHDFNGNTLAVTAAGLIDPATAANQYESVNAGSRLVAAVLKLTSRGPGTISDDANADLTLVGSDGQAYTPSFDDVSECTNFDHGNYTLLSGDSERGCVVFDVPNGVNVQSLQFSLDGSTAQFNNG